MFFSKVKDLSGVYIYQCRSGIQACAWYEHWVARTLPMLVWVERASPPMLSMWPLLHGKTWMRSSVKLVTTPPLQQDYWEAGTKNAQLFSRALKGSNKQTQSNRICWQSPVSDWLDSLIGPSGLLLVVSDKLPQVLAPPSFNFMGVVGVGKKKKEKIVSN